MELSSRTLLRAARFGVLLLLSGCASIPKEGPRLAQPAVTLAPSTTPAPPPVPPAPEPAPPAGPIARKPAPHRQAVATLGLPGLGQQVIPDNLALPCFFAYETNSERLVQGMKLIVALEDQDQNFGSTAQLDGGGLKGALIEFKVVAVAPAGQPGVQVRAQYLLLPKTAETDLAIPLETASLLPADTTTPSEANRYEAMEHAGQGASLFDHTIGNALIGDSEVKSNVEPYAKAAGYMFGRAKEDEAGLSWVRGKVAAGSRCTVRINRRILLPRGTVAN